MTQSSSTRGGRVARTMTCTACGGRGIIAFATEEVPCEACGQTGRVKLTDGKPAA